MRLRPLSPRPELLTDSQTGQLVDPAGNFVAAPPRPPEPANQPPLGRARIVSALPSRTATAVKLETEKVIADSQSAYLVDPDGNMIGKPGLWVMRMVSAGKVEDTRRL
jgi:hypothetical protein